MIDYLILKSYTRIKEERTLYAFYHLLKGKRSIQTVQDAHLYDLTNYYGIYKELSLFEYKETIKSLENRKLISINKKRSTLILTNKGKQYINESSYKNIEFKGLETHSLTKVFYNRLLLFIQVWTNSAKGCNNYIPVIDDFETEIFIKKLYLADINVDFEKLYKEFDDILKKLPEHYVLIFVERLTSYNQYGLSIAQLAQKNEVDKHTIQLIITFVTHQIINEVKKKPIKFQILFELLKDQMTMTTLNDSTTKTYHLFNQNKSLQEIAHIRKLKLNTIYDHIIEIALFDPNFDISLFVTQSVYDDIFNYINHNQTYKLKDIKKSIDEEISYFQIRLVLSALYSKKEGEIN